MVRNLLNVIDNAHRVICRLFVNIATVCLIIMTGIIVIQVFLRYFLGAPLSWPEEAAVYLMLWMAYLCLPYLVYSNQNISMTFLAERFKDTKMQYVLEIFYTMFIVFTGVVWYPFAIQGVKNGLLIALTQLPINMGVVLFVIPISLFFMLTIALQRLFISICLLLNVDLDEQHKVDQPFLQETVEDIQ